jgi:hypothetical protein
MLYYTGSWHKEYRILLYFGVSRISDTSDMFCIHDHQSPRKYNCADVKMSQYSLDPSDYEYMVYFGIFKYWSRIF